MTVFTRQLATANRLIDKYGETCTHKRYAAVAGVNAGFPAQGNTVSTACKIVWITDVRQIERYTTRRPDDIPQGAQFGLLAASAGVSPELRDTITKANGEVWNITTSDPLHPDGTALLYFVIVTQ